MRHEDTAVVHVRVMSSLGGWWKQTGDAVYLRNGIIERIGSTADVQAMASSRNAQVLDFASTLEIRMAGKPDNGAWILGDCWDDELWSDSPHRRQLDDLYPNSPVVLNRKRSQGG